MEELITNKVYYKIFDKTNKDLTHCYKVRNGNDKEVKKNISVVIKSLGAENLFLMNQAHGNDVICDKDFVFDGSVSGDGSVTTKKNIALGIFTADCVPILLSNEDGSVIGAAHCGWRSAKANIIEKLAKTIRQKSKSNMIAIIGPSIAQSSYEVSEDFYQDFTNESMMYKQFFIDGMRPNHHMFDLSSFVKHKLYESKIEIVKHIAEDTYIMKDKYPSFRRATHTNEPYSQNILSTIVLK